MYIPNYKCSASGFERLVERVRLIQVNTLKTSRFDPPDSCVASVGGSLYGEDLASRNSRESVLDAMFDASLEAWNVARQ